MRHRVTPTNHARCSMASATSPPTQIASRPDLAPAGPPLTERDEDALLESCDEPVPLDDDGVRDFAEMIWGNVNGVNLRENIAPTRSRADLVLKKGRDHSVEQILLRKR